MGSTGCVRLLGRSGGRVKVGLASTVGQSSKYRKLQETTGNYWKPSFNPVLRDLETVLFWQRLRSQQCCSPYLDRFSSANSAAHFSRSSANKLRSEAVTSKLNSRDIRAMSDPIQKATWSGPKRETSLLSAHTLEIDERRGLDGRKRCMLQTLLAAALLVAPILPPSADALQLHVVPEANIVGVATKEAANIIKSVQHNKDLEKAVEQIEVQVQGILTPEVRDMVRQVLPSPSAISSDISSGIQTLETKVETLESSLVSAIQASLESVKTSAEQLAARLSFPGGRSLDLQSLEASLSSRAGGVSVDPAVQRNLQSLQTELESRGSEWAQALRGGLTNVQVQLTELQEKIASSNSSGDQPVQNAISNAQDSVAAAVTNLGNMAGDALNFFPLRSPVTAAAEATLSRLGLFELWGFVIAQGERLIVLGPGIVLLATGWNAFRKRERGRIRESKRLAGPSPAVLLRSARVQRELVKLQVKGRLFEAVRQLGRAALAPSTDPASMSTRQDVETLIKQLKDLRTDPQPALSGVSASDPFADLSPAPDIDGKWELV